MDPNYDFFLDFTQNLQNDAEYNAWLDEQELYSQQQETPEDYWLFLLYPNKLFNPNHQPELTMTSFLMTVSSVLVSAAQTPYLDGYFAGAVAIAVTIAVNAIVIDFVYRLGTK